MAFLQRHACRIDFSKSAMLMGDRELACVDKFGRSLAGGVQVVKVYYTRPLPGHHSLHSPPVAISPGLELLKVRTLESDPPAVLTG